MMFGFGGSSQETPKDDIFDLDEIRQIVQEFPPPEDLIPLRSGTGFTTRNAVIKKFRVLLDGKDGRTLVSAIEQQLDLDRDVFLPVVRSLDGFMLSRSGDDLVTEDEQKRLVEKLYAIADGRFVLASGFTEDHDLDVQSITRLLELTEQVDDKSPLQLLNAQGVPTARSLELGYSYVHTLSTLLAMSSGIKEKIQKAQEDAKVVSWSGDDLLGLNVQTFGRLAHRFFEEINVSDDLHGSFEAGKDEVRFVPKTYLLRKARRSLKEVALGSAAYCDLDKLLKKYPALLPHLDAAKELAENECLHKDGTKYKWHFISHYAIGDVGLNNTAQKAMETMGPQRYLDTKPFAAAFPPDVRQDVLMLLQDRFHIFYRYCGGNVGTVLGLEEYLVYKSLLSDLTIAGKRIGRACADKLWKQGMENPMLSGTVETTAFLEQLSEESDIPVALLQRLWMDPRVEIRPLAMAAFSERISELQAGDRGQLEANWRSRVAAPLAMYKAGLESLPTDVLRDQLRDLLNVHLCQDLVPNAIKRIRKKGLVRGAVAQKKVAKLEAVAGGEIKTDIIAALTKFSEKMSIPKLSEEEALQIRDAHVTEMVQSAQTDTDGPRLFLSIVIILLASKHERGVIYATGKFAPRLLKVLKEHLNEDDYHRLEQIKDAVKAGSLGEADREEMRRMMFSATLSTTKSAESKPANSPLDDEPAT